MTLKALAKRYKQTSQHTYTYQHAHTKIYLCKQQSVLKLCVCAWAHGDKEAPQLPLGVITALISSSQMTRVKAPRWP